MGLFGGITRALTGVATGGLSEFARSNPFGVPGAGQYMPIAAGAGLGAMFGNPMMGAQLGAGIFGAQQAAGAQRDANATNMMIAQQQMMFSAQQAKQQMDFQEQMSNTSVQRMQQDMLKAGINPMLAAGAGESTPSGAMGSSAGARVDPVPSVALGISNSAKDVLNTYSTFKSATASADAARAQAGITRAKTPEAAFEGRIFSWFNDLVNRFSKHSAKELLPSAPWAPEQGFEVIP